LNEKLAATLNQFTTGGIILCPGFHAPELTNSFYDQLAGIELLSSPPLIFPSDRYAVYDAPAVVRFWHEQVNRQTRQNWLTVPLILIGFSAGAVAAMGAAMILESWGGTVQAVFLLDGWGVPIAGRFPTHRLSHDRFTDWSSAWLGAGQASFYADPEVDHLALWRSPAAVSGYGVLPSTPVPVATTALHFFANWLRYYQSLQEDVEKV
jgi:hypothetical protein